MPSFALFPGLDNKERREGSEEESRATLAHHSTLRHGSPPLLSPLPASGRSHGSKLGGRKARRPRTQPWNPEFCCCGSKTLPSPRALRIDTHTNFAASVLSVIPPLRFLFPSITHTHTLVLSPLTNLGVRRPLGPESALIGHLS